MKSFNFVPDSKKVLAQCSQACSHLINRWCFCNHILRGKSLWRWFQCAQFLSTFLVLAFWWYVASISCFQSLNNIVGTRGAAPINQKRSGGEKYECIQSREMKAAPRFNALPKLLHHHRCSKYHTITFTLHKFFISQYHTLYISLYHIHTSHNIFSKMLFSPFKYDAAYKWQETIQL